MNQHNEDMYRKALGLMQSSTVRPLRIITDHEKAEVRICHHNFVLGTYSQERFTEMTVHELLDDMGVPRNDQ